MPKPTLRKQLSAPGLLGSVRRCFQSIKDAKDSRALTLADCLMSGLAVFSLKYPSLLQFDRQQNEEALVRKNLRALYGVEQAPSDTWLRQRLDEVNPVLLRKVFTKLFAHLQRGKGLEGFDYLDGHYLLSVDGTGYFSSSKVHCANCCEKHHRDGRVTYYHQMLCGVLVHPDHSEVFPFAPEPIMQADGSNKNDCERNASTRFLKQLKREHPHLKLLVVEDGLASNGPHIKLLKSLNYSFILGAKESDHGFLFDWVEPTKETRTVEQTDELGVHRRFRYVNGVPLNDSHFELEVNFLEVWETSANGKTRHFSWVSDLLLSDDNLIQIMRGARARWKIENETFNTLKNQGYHFEHNFGHGNKHLSAVFASLMLLAFLIDQIQQRCCPLFRQAQQKKKSKVNLWESLRGLFLNHLIPHWEALLCAMAYGIKVDEPIAYNTS